MITNDLLDFYLKINNKKDEDINYSDASILNMSLYSLLNSKYMNEDYFEVVPMYNMDKDYFWLHRNSKFIPGKTGNNLVLESLLDVCGMNYDKEWSDVKSNSQPILLEEDVNKWRFFEKEFSIQSINSIGKEKIKNYLNIHKDELFDDICEMLIDRPSERKLGKIIEKYSLNIDSEEDEIFLTLQSKFYKENKENIGKYSNSLKIENFLKKENVENFNKTLENNIDYIKSLKEKPSDKKIDYKVFEMSTESEHRDFNKWVSKSMSPLLMTNSAWTNYGQKGLFYLSPVSQEDGISKRYVVVAHNDIEIIGVTQLNDLSTAKSLNQRDNDAYKMPFIGIQQKYRGKGVASKLFKEVLNIVEKDKKFLLRTSPSEMGGKFTQAKFTEMGKCLKEGILVNSEENNLYENFKEQVKDTDLDFGTKRLMYNILKEEMLNKLIEDRSFHFNDAHKLMTDDKVITRFKNEIFEPSKEKKRIKLKV
jgi:ribosomal protein S18 acetylase RimI-like enzyme